MESFATLEDIYILWRELKESEHSKAEQLLTVVSDSQMKLTKSEKIWIK